MPDLYIETEGKAECKKKEGIKPSHSLEDLKRELVKIQDDLWVKVDKSLDSFTYDMLQRKNQNFSRKYENIRMSLYQPLYTHPGLKNLNPNNIERMFYYQALEYTPKKHLILRNKKSILNLIKRESLSIESNDNDSVKLMNDFLNLKKIMNFLLSIHHPLTLNDKISLSEKEEVKFRRALSKIIKTVSQLLIRCQHNFYNVNAHENYKMVSDYIAANFNIDAILMFPYLSHVPISKNNVRNVVYSNSVLPAMLSRSYVKESLKMTQKYFSDDKSSFSESFIDMQMKSYQMLLESESYKDLPEYKSLREQLLLGLLLCLQSSQKPENLRFLVNYKKELVTVFIKKREKFKDLDQLIDNMRVICHWKRVGFSFFNRRPTENYLEKKCSKTFTCFQNMIEDSRQNKHDFDAVYGYDQRHHNKFVVTAQTPLLLKNN
jgi:hypothetical protein